MNQPNTIYFVFKLMDRGLSIEEIDDAMVKTIGKGWNHRREMDQDVQGKRLYSEGIFPIIR